MTTPSGHVRAKICGLSTSQTLKAAVSHGASHVGFVHFPASPRHLSLDRFSALKNAVPADVESVAVLVNPDDSLLDAIQLIEPQVLQLHRMVPERVAEVRARWSGSLWVGLPVGSAGDVAASVAFAPFVDRVLFDAHTDLMELPGGTGRVFDWSLLRRSPPPVPWILSGGLDPDNVAAAIATTDADFVDVSSGVESAPGVKDVDKIAAFLTACRP